MVSYASSLIIGALIGSLNPCCNGRWSRTATFNAKGEFAGFVLILVVMEDGLVRK